MKRLLLMLITMLLMCTAACAEGFVGMANPWIDTTQQDLETRTGMHLRAPEEAENLLWRVLVTADLAEMRFTFAGTEYTVRAIQAEYYRDISGMYYSWVDEQECRIGGCIGMLQVTWSVDEKVILCQWYDEAAGVMYSLAGRGMDFDEADVLAVAETVSIPQSAWSLAGALTDCTGMAGSAGASLKRAAACSRLLGYAVQMSAADCDPAVLAVIVQEAWALLSPEQQVELALNLPAMNELLTAADPLTDGAFADAGVAEEVAALLGTDGALVHWSALYQTVSAFFRAE